MNKRNLFAAIVVVIMCIVGIIEPYIRRFALESKISASMKLYDLLANYDFDGIDMNEHERFVMLYEYVKESDETSGLVQREVASIFLERELMDAVKAFRNIRSFCNGIFFATLIGWDGEWTGIYVTDGEIELPELPEECAVEKVCEGIYWLAGVPYHILFDY